MAIETLWVEKYRPKTVTDYVWRDHAQHDQVMQWVSSKSIPHLLLSGAPGTGKTTLAKVLLNELEVEPMDICRSMRAVTTVLSSSAARLKHS